VVIAYPEGVWYKDITPDLGKDLVRMHVKGELLKEQMVYSFDEKFIATGNSIVGQSKPSHKI
jgi:(2Fe-2S) ferredoxin